MKRIVFPGITLFSVVLLFAFTGAVNETLVSMNNQSGNHFRAQDTVIPTKVELERTTMNDM
jgi:hypothetical protein